MSYYDWLMLSVLIFVFAFCGGMLVGYKAGREAEKQCNAKIFREKDGKAYYVCLPVNQ